MGRDDNKIYVGNLPPDVREKEVTDIFSKYGKVKGVEVKGSSSRGPVFAFVEFGDSRDADDAIRGRDGYDFEGYRLRVEMTRGVGPRGPGGRPFSGGGRDFDRDRRDGHRDGRRDFRPRGGPPSKRTDYRVIIEGLPSTGSWQDLKDHMREAGEVCFADVARDGTGVVEFARSEDMDYAIKKLDDTKFKSHKGDTAYIRVREGGPGRGDRDRSRSPRRSPKYAQRSPSPHDSASPGHSRSRSRSRSHS